MFLDIFVIFILAVSTLIAFMRGFIREALTLVTIAVALAATYYGAPHLQPFMNDWLGVQEGAAEPARLFGVIPMTIVSLLLSYGSIFIILLLIFSISSHFIAEFAKSLGLGAIDRSLGALFGLLRGLVLLAILYMPLHFLLDDQTKESWFGKSRSHVYLEKAAIALADYLPDDFIEQQVETVQDSPLGDEDTIKGAREKLQALDLLQKDLSDEDREKLMKLKDSKGMDSPDSEGYSDEFRQELDTLFQENSDQPETNE